ncbi:MULTISPECIES: DUF928 domain-containing protein [Planktothricoides]|uniref:DUF928 domain-containing protein n=2 Tax=Planktothricoides raciborskii TaxID=132608 RepID=A0AAU8JLR2_9CYAN|nr:MULTISPECIES: DUF928 domain-containing protein [Planktothricoides]MBD2547731.1 DUF928 domain-containing protein [Planktothricoides raciborskii FACHB-1370]MBD2586151.1 DUF928 domain-containing protein [Planktothricoides raciborskii FACHB-1261]
MTIQKIQKPFTTLISCALLLNSLVVGLPAVNAVEFSAPNTPPPSRRVGGAVRGASASAQTCLNNNQKELTALVPKVDVALTTQEYPVFFWYLPPNSATMISFNLIDDSSGEIIYESTMKTTGEGGILSLSLPENSGLPALEIGKDYYWSLAIICDRLDLQANPFVEGLIRRVEPPASLQQKLKQASALERVNLYANAGFWYDTIAELANLRRSNPDDSQLAQEWEELLRSVQLDRLVLEPLNPNIISEFN